MAAAKYFAFVVKSFVSILHRLHGKLVLWHPFSFASSFEGSVWWTTFLRLTCISWVLCQTKFLYRCLSVFLFCYWSCQGIPYIDVEAVCVSVVIEDLYKSCTKCIPVFWSVDCLTDGKVCRLYWKRCKEKRTRSTLVSKSARNMECFVNFVSRRQVLKTFTLGLFCSVTFCVPCDLSWVVLLPER